MQTTQKSVSPKLRQTNLGRKDVVSSHQFTVPSSGRITVQDGEGSEGEPGTATRCREGTRGSGRLS